MTGRNTYQKQWAKDNEGHIKQYNRQWYKNNSECRKENTKQWKKDNPEKVRQWNKDNPRKRRQTRFKCSYGLSYEDWQEMWDNQDGKCAICAEPFKNPSSANVDHNHETDKIRGLLCQKCNLGLGLFNDNPRLVFKAFEYLLGDK